MSTNRESPKLNVLHLTPTIGPKAFGIGPIALNIAKEQQRLGCSVQIWSIDTPEDIHWASKVTDIPRKIIRPFSCTGPNFLSYSPEMEGLAMKSDGGKFDFVHQHGIWTGISRVTYKLVKKHNIPSAIAPHGSLESWALKRSNWKKKIAKCLYESRNLNTAACLHATAEPEVSDFRKFGLSNPIAVIPNGVNSKWLTSEGRSDYFRKHFKIDPQKRILLFLSRITPKKGLIMLLKAISMIMNDFENWILLIIGPDEFGHKSEVKTLVKDLGLVDAVKFIHPLFNQLKRDAFSAADLFILPSYSEGAPIVILEALAAEVPVITTKASPWPELISHGCGWWVDINVKKICEALKNSLSMSREKLQVMGRNGKKLVTSKYTWSISAQMTIDLYLWILKQREIPDFVHTNQSS